MSWSASSSFTFASTRETGVGYNMDRAKQHPWTVLRGERYDHRRKQGQISMFPQTKNVQDRGRNGVGSGGVILGNMTSKT